MCDFNPKNKSRFIDPCMRSTIEALKHQGIKTVACCCGHGKYPPTIVIKLANGNIQEINSGEYLHRKKRYYKRDAEGVYYIPEVGRLK